MRDLKKVRDDVLLRRLKKAMEQVEAAQTLHDVPNLTKLSGLGSIVFNCSILLWFWKFHYRMIEVTSMAVSKINKLSDGGLLSD